MFPELITELLQEGYKVNFSAPGHSMFPTILANESIIVAPIDPKMVRLRDIILYRTNGQLIAHRVVSITKGIDDALKLSKNSNKLQSNLFIKGESTLVKRSARQAQRSSNEVLPPAQRSSPGRSTGSSTSAALLERSAPSPQRSSNEVLKFVLRGDAAVACDKPVAPAQILGKVVAVERYGRNIDPYSFNHKVQSLGLTWLARTKRLHRLMSSIFFKNDR